MPTASTAPYEFDLSGGIFCLDFVNTVSHRADAEKRSEHLTEYPDLIFFAQQSGLISPRRADETRAQTRRDGHGTKQTFVEAISFRETLYRVFSAIAQGKPAQPADLRAIGEAAADALQHRKLIPAGESYRWEWKTDRKNDLKNVLWQVATSAADLLTSEKLRSVRMCEAPDCEWLFLDQSRNRSRRWCDMTVCGNRAKARRHYERSRN